MYEYTHPENYADVVIAFDCYRDKPKNVELITMKKVLGVNEIISRLEIWHFMYLYDKDFRQDYEKAKLKTLYNFNIKNLPI